MDLNTKKRMKNEDKVSSEKAEETKRKVVVKPGRTERKSEGGLCAVKLEKKSRGSESGFSPGFFAKQELGRKGKRESANKYSSPTSIGKKRKRTSPGDINCAPTSPGKLYHGRTWLPVGEGESEVDCDPTWNGEHMVRRLEEIIDLNTGEKALMAMWNSFLALHVGPVWIHMDALARQFVDEKGLKLVELGLYRNCILHLIALHQARLISGETVLNCVHLLQVDWKEKLRTGPGAT